MNETPTERAPKTADAVLGEAIKNRDESIFYSQEKKTVVFPADEIDNKIRSYLGRGGVLTDEVKEALDELKERLEGIAEKRSFGYRKRENRKVVAEYFDLLGPLVFSRQEKTSKVAGIEVDENGLDEDGYLVLDKRVASPAAAEKNTPDSENDTEGPEASLPTEGVEEVITQEALRENFDDSVKMVRDAYEAKGLTVDEIEKLSKPEGPLADIKWKRYIKLMGGVVRNFEISKSKTQIDPTVISSQEATLNLFLHEAEKIVDILNGYDSAGEGAVVEKELTDREATWAETKEANKALREIKKKYEDALTEHYKELDAKNIAARGLHYTKEMFGISPKTSERVQQLQEEYVNARKDHQHKFAEALTARKAERQGGPNETRFDFEDEGVKEMAAHKYILNVVRKRLDIQQKHLTQSERFKSTREFLKNNRIYVRIGTVAVAGALGALSGGAALGGIAAGRKLGAMAGGAALGGVAARKTYSSFSEKIAGKESDIRDARADIVSRYDHNAADLQTAEDSLMKKHENLSAARKRQKTASVAAAFGTGALVGGSAAALEDALTSVPESEALDLSNNNPAENDMEQQGPEVDGSEIPAQAEVSGTVGTAAAAEVPEVPQSEEASVYPLPESEQLTAEEVFGENEMKFGEALEGFPEELDLSSIVYHVQPGDNLWNILEGDVGTRDMSEVLEKVPVGDRNAALAKLFDVIDNDPDLQKDIGLKTPPENWAGGPSDYIQANQNINIGALEAALQDVVDKGDYSLSENVGPADVPERVVQEKIVPEQFDSVAAYEIDDLQKSFVNSYIGEERFAQLQDVSVTELRGTNPDVASMINDAEKFVPVDGEETLGEYMQRYSAESMIEPETSEMFDTPVEQVVEEVESEFLKDHLGLGRGNGFWGGLRSPTAFQVFEDTTMGELDDLASVEKGVDGQAITDVEWKKLNTGVSVEKWNALAQMTKEMYGNLPPIDDESLGEYVRRYVESGYANKDNS